jgi:hypothetical protein
MSLPPSAAEIAESPAPANPHEYHVSITDLVPDIAATALATLENQYQGAVDPKEYQTAHDGILHAAQQFLQQLDVNRDGRLQAREADLTPNQTGDLYRFDPDNPITQGIAGQQFDQNLDRLYQRMDDAFSKAVEDTPYPAPFDGDDFSKRMHDNLGLNGVVVPGSLYHQPYAQSGIEETGQLTPDSGGSLPPHARAR